MYLNRTILPCVVFCIFTLYIGLGPTLLNWIVRLQRKSGLALLVVKASSSNFPWPTRVDQKTFSYILDHGTVCGWEFSSSACVYSLCLLSKSTARPCGAAPLRRQLGRNRPLNDSSGILTYSGHRNASILLSKIGARHHVNICRWLLSAVETRVVACKGTSRGPIVQCPWPVSSVFRGVRVDHGGDTCQAHDYPNSRYRKKA